MRWLTEDPIAEDGGLNLYGFCGNNGVHNIDFLGERIEIKEDNLIVRDKISSTARAAFFPSADVTFSCSWNGVLSIDGVACRRIEIQTPDQERWNTRNKNYNKKWGAERTNTMEWSAAYAHEMDHWNAFNSFFSFLHMLNEFDGTELCNKCTEMKEELEKQYNTMWLEAYQHSAKYDMPGYNGGGLYPKAK
jgi:hypothetical protein